jgi:hypothetical protein
VYAREIDGKVYDFGVSGKLIMNVLVMYDRQTETYWSQLLGEAVEGALAGTQLQFVPSWFTTWSEWKEQFPNTVALEKGSASGDSYSGYYNDGRAGVIGESTDDDRLDTKQFVIGVESMGEAVAYPFDILRSEPVINDMVGELSVMIVFVEDGAVGLVYDRSVAGQELTFNGDTGQLRDDQTGSVWDPWRGVAINGPLEGQVLVRVPSTRSFWFGWKDWYPETKVYDR